MLKNIEYGLPRPVGLFTKGLYAEEVNAIHDFSTSDKLTMRLEYDSAKSAVNARATIKKYTKNMPVILTQRDKYLWVIKESKDNV